MTEAVLALGANIGDPAAQLETAVQRIAAHPRIALQARSGIRITAPWGKTDQNDFHNMALLVKTDLPPLALLDAVLAIERAMGRERLEKWGPRLIDIDLIAYGRETIALDRLTVPHPFAHERDFVLDPVREIAPEIADWLIARRRV